MLPIGAAGFTQSAQYPVPVSAESYMFGNRTHSHISYNLVDSRACSLDSRTQLAKYPQFHS